MKETNKLNQVCAVCYLRPEYAKIREESHKIYIGAPNKELLHLEIEKYGRRKFEDIFYYNFDMKDLSEWLENSYFDDFIFNEKFCFERRFKSGTIKYVNRVNKYFELLGYDYRFHVTGAKTTNNRKSKDITYGKLVDDALYSLKRNKTKNMKIFRVSIVIKTLDKPFVKFFNSVSTSVSKLDAANYFTNVYNMSIHEFDDNIQGIVSSTSSKEEVLMNGEEILNIELTNKG